MDEQLRWIRLLDKFPDPILVTDAEMHIVFANTPWEKLTGYKLTDVKGKTPKLLQTDRTPKSVYKQLWKMLSEGKPFRTDRIVNRKKNGKTYQIHSIIFPFQENGKIFYIQIEQDITLHRKVDRVIRQRERQYRLLFAQNPNPMWIYDNRTLSFLSVNAAAVRQYGYLEEEFMAMKITDLRSKEDVPKLMRWLENRKRRKLETIGEWRHMKKDGTTIEVEVTRSPIRFEGRQGTLVMAQDITKRKNAQRRLRESEKRYHALVEAANDAIITADAKTGIIVNVNRKAEELLGVEAKELIGRHQTDLHPSQDSGKYKKLFREHVKKGRAIVGEEVFILHSSGAHIPVEISASVFDVNGKKSIVGIIRDISQRKHLDDLKTEFLSVAAHELRTPITSLKLFIEVMRRKHHKSEEANRDFALLQTELNKLNELISDLFDVSRIDAKKMLLRLSDLDITALARSSVKKMRLVANGHTLLLKKSPSFFVAGDRERLEQVFVNLLSNAIKYSPKGSTITVLLEKKGARVVVSVSDQGIGIPRSKIIHLFEKFYQIEERGVSGFGLGLYICKEIIERHRGRIWVRSKVGKRSTFSFSLPLSD